MNGRDGNLVLSQGNGIIVRIAIFNEFFTHEPVIHISTRIVAPFKAFLKPGGPLPRQTYAYYFLWWYRGNIHIQGCSILQITLHHKPDDLLAETGRKQEVRVF